MSGNIVNMMNFNATLNYCDMLRGFESDSKTCHIVARFYIVALKSSRVTYLK